METVESLENVIKAIKKSIDVCNERLIHDIPKEEILFLVDFKRNEIMNLNLYQHKLELLTK